MSTVELGTVAFAVAGDARLVSRLSPELDPYHSQRAADLGLHFIVAPQTQHELGEMDVGVTHLPDAGGCDLRLVARDAVATYLDSQRLLTIAIDPRLLSQHRLATVYVSRLLLRAFLAEWVVWHGGFAIHASAAVHDGEAILFCGSSGAGKSTIVSHFPNQRVLNDDFSVVRRLDDRFWCGGTPITLKPKITVSPGRFPVRGLYQIVQSARLERQRLTPEAMLPWMVPNVHCFGRGGEGASRLLTVCTEFVQTVECGILEFNLTENVWSALGQP